MKKAFENTLKMLVTGVLCLSFFFSVNVMAQTEVATDAPTTTPEPEMKVTTTAAPTTTTSTTTPTTTTTASTTTTVATTTPSPQVSSGPTTTEAPAASDDSASAKPTEDFDCSVLEKCEAENNSAKILELLEEKIIKLEKQVVNQTKQFEEVETKLMKMKEELEQCKCSSDETPSPREGMPSSSPPPEEKAETPTPPSTESPAPQPETPSANETTPSTAPPPQSPVDEYYPLQTKGDPSRCLEAGVRGVVVKKCNPNNPLQGWKMVNGTFQNKVNNFCLDGSGGFGILAIPCNDGNLHQQWQILPDNTIKNTGSTYCLTAGVLSARLAHCDGEFWQQYDLLERLKRQGTASYPGWYLVTLYY